MKNVNSVYKLYYSVTILVVTSRPHTAQCTLSTNLINLYFIHRKSHFHVSGLQAVAAIRTLRVL